MNRELVGVAALIAAVFYSARANARSLPYSEPVFTEMGEGDTAMEYVTSQTPLAFDVYDYETRDFLGNSIGVQTVPKDSYSNEDQRVQAFLYVIRSSEHLFPRDVVSGADYNIFYGGSTFSDMSDHPVLTGEKRGIPLSPEMCRNAGFANGKCVSTAAGAYQFTRPTWVGLRAAGAWGPRLPDFSPVSQDAAAVRLLGEIGALDAIRSGAFDKAIQIAGRKWASLPGAVAKQNQRSREFVLARYNEALDFA